MASPAQYLWTPSHNQVVIETTQPPSAAADQLRNALASSDEVLGRVVNQGVKLWRSRRYAHSRNTFAPILYAVFQPTASGSRLVGHFQLNPVMRLFLTVWFVGTTLTALAMLWVAWQRATPQSQPGEAIPYLLPALLPLLGWLLLRWQQSRGRQDEVAIQEWVQSAMNGK